MKNRLYYLRFIRTIIAEGEGGGSGEGQGDPAPEPDAGAEGKGDEQLGESGLKALKAEREANKAAKATIAEYEAKLKAIEDQGKTESEKETERVKTLERSNTENALKVLQYEVAAEKGIPLSLANRLRGEDKESMLKDADGLLPLIQHDTKQTGPKPDKSQGKGGNPKPASLTQAIAGHLK
ncbi:hypothetical protein BPY_22870 [Bifidobacterium psychraerophilum]|uniref:DUF4355 domain-containing protein n=1 Tax=Bifidobacterium psychraerophilum TaxID=218140 RepID=UPI003114A4C4